MTTHYGHGATGEYRKPEKYNGRNFADNVRSLRGRILMVFIRKVRRGDTLIIDEPCRIEVDRKKPRRLKIMKPNGDSIAVKLVERSSVKLDRTRRIADIAGARTPEPGKRL